MLGNTTDDLERQVQERTAELQATIRALQIEIAAHERAEQAQRSAEDALAQHAADESRKLGALYEVILMGSQALPIGELLQQSLDKIVAVVGSDAACIHDWDTGSGQLRLAAHYGLEPAARQHLHILPAGWLPENNLARSIGDLAADPEVPWSLRLASYRGYLGSHICLHGQVVGALSVFWNQPQHFPVEDISLFTTLADQLGIIIENARLRARIEAQAAQRERRRLARDLHDSVTQSLHGLVLLVDTTRLRLRRNQLDQADASLEQVAESARQALKEMRLLLYELRLAPLVELDLVEALQTRMDTVERRANVTATLVVDENARWPKEWEGELYRIATEALNNSLKHGSARHVTVHLRGAGRQLELEVTDDGKGFDVQRVPAGGLGLSSMSERVERLGGVFSVTSAPGTGTRVQLRVEHAPIEELV